MNAKEVAIERVKRELAFIEKQLAIVNLSPKLTNAKEVAGWEKTAESCRVILEYWNSKI